MTCICLPVSRTTDRFDISISLNVLLISAELGNSKHEAVKGTTDLPVRYLAAETLGQQRMCREGMLASGRGEELLPHTVSSSTSKATVPMFRRFWCSSHTLVYLFVDAGCEFCNETALCSKNTLLQTLLLGDS